MEKLKARIAVSVHCPKCEFVMVKVNDLIECPNSSCALHGQRFQMPWFLLEPWLEDDEIGLLKTKLAEATEEAELLMAYIDVAEPYIKDKTFLDDLQARLSYLQNDVIIQVMNKIEELQGIKQ